MRVFALSDPHLSLGVPNKSMDRFGSVWINHIVRMAENWDALVRPDDIVLVPGDISWAKKPIDVLPDLEWLHARPGIKVLLKGNHDLWWPTAQQMEAMLPSSLRFIQHNHVKVGPYLFFGSRLWDTDAYSVFDLIEWDIAKGPIPGVKSEEDVEAQRKFYERELHRLQLSIDTLPKDESGIRIGLTHYPPLDHHCQASQAHRMFQAAGARHVVFGHLHSVKNDWIGRAFGDCEGIQYHLTSCDYLNMAPKLIHDSQQSDQGDSFTKT